MTMNKVNKIIITAALSFAFFGCEEQVLEQAPRDFFSDIDVWNNWDLTQKFENSIYEGLGSWSVGLDTHIMYAVYSDEAMGAEDLRNSYTINLGNISADMMGAFEGIWGEKYKYIRMANIFLAEIDDMEQGPAEEKSVLKGEVKFIRARMYFDLIKHFGGVPLITNVFGLNDDFTVGRASYEELVDWIVKELDEAKELVPLERPSAEWGRVTKGACLGTKAEVLLYANSKLHDPGSEPGGPLFEYTKDTWQDCADAAKAVIDMPFYELQPVSTWEDYHNIFLKPNSEMVFARVMSLDYTSTNNSINRYMGPGKDGGSAGVQPFQHLVDEYEMSNGMRIDEAGSGYDPSVGSIYDNRDLRFEANILHQGSSWKTPFEVVYPTGFEVTSPPRKSTGYSLRKFMDKSVMINQQGAPWPWLRLATIYLIYAEAQYELGNEPLAREYVNKIRNRVGLPDITSTGDALFADIQHERRIELCFENHRFFDVRRWMIAESTEQRTCQGIVWRKLDGNGELDPNGQLTYTLEAFQERSFDPKFYYLPIPRSEIEKSGLVQNPGY